MSAPKRESLTWLNPDEAQAAPNMLVNVSTMQGSQPAKSSVGSEPKASLFVRLRSLINSSGKTEPTDLAADETYRNLALSLGNEAIQPPNLGEDAGEHGPQSPSNEPTPPKVGH